MPVAIATDIGGTFTDLVVYDLETGEIRHSKSYTDPKDLSDGIARCLDKSGVSLADTTEFIHGSTVAINTAIERTGVPTALFVTRGMRDIYEIGRGNRLEAYNLMFRRPLPLVPRQAIYEVDERLSAAGEVIRSLDLESLDRAIRDALRSGAESIAVCFLHSYANPTHEDAAGKHIESRAPGVYLSLSNQILREYREYERISTTVMNAYIGPKVSGYLDDLEGVLVRKQFVGRTLVMQSNGGVMSLDTARREPVMMMESGPVGGVIAAGSIAKERGLANAVAFDMGGTTAKVALLRDGVPEMTSGYYVGGAADGLPIRVPVVDVVEIGAGGGSIAHLDETGALRIGPQSAGGRPGPVCYGWGGEEPTVTDANAILGRLNPGRFLGGEMSLDLEHAGSAINERLGDHLGLSKEQCAMAIINIAVNMMGLAVRSVSIERGVDPRDCALIAFGGAGPLHACAVARELNIPRVIVPVLPGHFSALGMLLADLRHEYVRTVYRTFAEVRDPALHSIALEMTSNARSDLENEKIPKGDQEYEIYLDLRYQGQEFTIRTPSGLAELLPGPDGLLKVRQRFDGLHELRFGHCSEGSMVEIVNLRVVGVGKRGRFRPNINRMPQAEIPSRRRVFSGQGSNAVSGDWLIYQREALTVGTFIQGPAIIEEYASTVVLAAGDMAEISADGAIDIAIDTSHLSAAFEKGEGR